MILAWCPFFFILVMLSNMHLISLMKVSVLPATTTIWSLLLPSLLLATIHEDFFVFFFNTPNLVLLLLVGRWFLISLGWSLELKGDTTLATLNLAG
jgi:hypothetical protein